MKRSIKNVIAVLLCLIMVFSTASISFAASVGKVKTLKIDSVSTTSVKITWSKVSKAAGYRVYSYDETKKAWVTEKDTTSTSFKDTDLKPGTKHTYKVKAYINSNGKKVYGDASNKVVALTKPNGVTNVTASKVTGSAITLKWSKSSGATGYIVYLRDNKTGEYKKLASTTKTSYTAKFDAAPGKVYFKVKSYAKISGITQYSSLSSAVKVTAKPGTIEQFTASNQTGASVELSWNKCDGATGYIVYRLDYSNTSFEEMERVDKERYTVVYPSAPGKCYFKIRPYSVTDGEELMGTLSPYVMVDMYPQKVKGLKVAEETRSSITISWNKSDSASYYEVYQLKSNGKYGLVTKTNETTCTVSELNFAESYSFKVREVSDYSEKILYGAYSDVVTGKTSFGDISGVKFTVDTDNTAYLMWNEISDADGYVVEKKVGSEWEEIFNSKATLCMVSDYEAKRKLQPGYTYIYRIRAYTKTASGTNYTNYTDDIYIKAVPDVPQDLSIGTGSNHSIALQWEKVEGADGYDIFYYDYDNGVWREYIDTAGTEYTSMVNGKTYVKYNEKNLETSGYYKYKVRAYAMNNGTKCVGAFSREIAEDYVYSPDRDPLFEGGVNTSGVLGYLYDEKYDCFYTAGDPWQRNFGFNEVYDISAQWVLLQYDTARFKFRYEGKDWMIQPWKGQYGWILYGGEVGVYVKYTDRDIEHYDCAKDEDLLMMEMSLYRYWEQLDEWLLAFKRPYSSYWWCTGFKPGFIKFDLPGTTSYSDDLRIDMKITMKDFEMLEAFVNSLENVEDKKYKPYKNVTGKKSVDEIKNGTEFIVDGLDVYFTFK